MLWDRAPTFPSPSCTEEQQEDGSCSPLPSSHWSTIKNNCQHPYPSMAGWGLIVGVVVHTLLVSSGKAQACPSLPHPSQQSEGRREQDLQWVSSWVDLKTTDEQRCCLSWLVPFLSGTRDNCLGSPGGSAIPGHNYSVTISKHDSFVTWIYDCPGWPVEFWDGTACRHNCSWGPFLLPGSPECPLVNWGSSNDEKVGQKIQHKWEKPQC